MTLRTPKKVVDEESEKDQFIDGIKLLRIDRAETARELRDFMMFSFALNEINHVAREKILIIIEELEGVKNKW